MPALDNYGWRQRNPWRWGFDYQGNQVGGNNGGGGGGGGGGGADAVQGPFMAFGTQFWVRTSDCRVGFDVDADPDADIWVTGAQVCAGDLEQRVKDAISAQLEALDCAPLPCATP